MDITLWDGSGGGLLHAIPFYVTLKFHAANILQSSIFIVSVGNENLAISSRLTVAIVEIATQC